MRMKLILILCLSFLLSSTIDAKDLSLETGNNPLGDNMNIDEAKEEFNKKYNVQVLLPKSIPFEATHIGATLGINDPTLRISYYKESTQQAMIVDIKLNSKGLNQRISDNIEKTYLSDGTLAMYHHDSKEVADRLHFIKNNLEYRIGIMKNKQKVTLSLLKLIAESIE